MKLFSQEAVELTKNVVVEPIKKTRKPRIEKKPSISDLKYKREDSMKRLEELKAQDETGWNESDIWYKGKKTNMPLVESHIAYYSKQINELRSPFTCLLNRWKNIIVDYCKEKGQEIELIWFSDSTPYDCEVCVRMKNHNCWSECVSFRFQDYTLHAYDSGFGGGTTFVKHLDYKNNPNLEVENVKDVMDRVFNMECSKDYVRFWKKEDFDNVTHREIKLDEAGWIL